MASSPPLQLKKFLPAGMSPDEFYILLAVVGSAVCAFAIWKSFYQRDTIGPRARALRERRAELQAEMQATRRRKRPEGSINLIRRLVSRFELLKQTQVGQIQTLLIEAGWRSKDAIIIFAFFNVAAPIIGLALGVAMLPMIELEGTLAMLKGAIVILTTYMGLKMPVWVVRWRRKKRYYQLQRSLADTLDLMTICAEAGLSLGASLDRVSRELSLAYPEMGEELSLTSLEMGFLPERNKALVNWATRAQLPEIRGVVSVLIQTEKYGTPITQALRTLGNEFRTQRMLRAEQKAARLPAIMTVPMILFILPTLFIIILAPAVIQIKGMMQ